MRKLLSLLLLTLLFLHIPADAAKQAQGRQVDAKSWSHLQTVDVNTLARSLDSYVHHLVAIKFTFRGKDIYHMKANWFEGSLWQADEKSGKGFSKVRVQIAKADIAAFKSITENAASTEELTLYGWVQRDVGAKYIFVEALGRSATTATDNSGKTSFSW